MTSSKARPKAQTTAASVDFEILRDNAKGEDEHDVVELDLPASPGDGDESFESGRLTKAPVNVSFIVEACVILILIAALAVVVGASVVRQYKKSTNPLNYKSKQDSASTKNANEEFSEIRFLTSDETLDFNLMSPAENSSDL